MIILFVIIGVIIFLVQRTKSQDLNSPTFILSALPSFWERLQIKAAAVITPITYDDLLTIAAIESNFDQSAIGLSGEVSMFQITEPVLIDYFNATGQNFTSEDLISSVGSSARVASWLLSQHYEFYDGDLEFIIKAYNTGRGGVNSERAVAYWGRFQEVKPLIEGIIF